MCLLGDGSAQRQARADTSQFEVGNGIGSFATRRNSNAPNVRTASFSHWDTMTFTITSKVKIRMGAMWSVSMRYFRIIPVASYAATSMTRIASMVIKRMLWHTSVFAATGGFQRISSVHDRAMALMSGFCLMNQSKLEQLEVLVMQF